MNEESHAPDTPGGTEAPAAPAQVAPQGERRCHDCGTVVVDLYCSHCGQEYSERVVSLRRLLGDFLGDIAAWDSKIGRSLFHLLFRPGSLTNAYNAGRRTRFISPWRIYLVSSLIAFFALSWNLKRSETGVVDLGAAQRAGEAPKLDVEMGDPKLDRLLKKPDPVAAYEKEQQALPEWKRDSWLERRANARLLQAGKATTGANAEPYFEDFIRRTVANVPNGMFVLLPIFAALLKVIYWRSGRYYIEHLVFALHTHAFAYTVIALDVLVRQAWWHTVAPAAVGLYILLAMKSVYQERWLRTAVKLLVLTASYLLLLTLTLAGVMLATFFG